VINIVLVNKCFKSSRGLLSSILIYLIACQLDKLQIQVGRPDIQFEGLIS
jgi:hypothetical protein